MLAASISLAVLAFALAWPVPLLLGRATWPARAPGTALVLWQAIALAGGLSMIGSLLTFGLIPFGDSLLESASTFLGSLPGGPAVSGVDLAHLVALCGAFLLGTHLVLNLILTITLTQRQRARHRQLVQLLSSPVVGQPNTRIIEHAVPVAYCLPGTHHSVTVFSAGLVRLLDATELKAVIEHEKAHLLQRHYIVLMAFDAWRSSLPWFPIATRAQREVGLLVEMLADDYARRMVDDRTLATAIALVSVGTPEAEAMPSLTAEWNPREPSGEQLEARVGRLINGRAALSLPSRLSVRFIALALVAVPTVLLLAPAITSVALAG
ncbi:MAG: family peptidase [Glaciihabitans sp.]|nr:family peptidase [Glaciihabitans sp.]